MIFAPYDNNGNNLVEICVFYEQGKRIGVAPASGEPRETS